MEEKKGLTIENASYYAIIFSSQNQNIFSG